VDNIDQLLAVKTRLTTIKGYAQLLAREIERAQPPSQRLGARIVELNQEIARLIELVRVIESSIARHADAERGASSPDGDDYMSSGC
jgi:hypothetical protein